MALRVAREVVDSLVRETFFSLGKVRECQKPVTVAIIMVGGILVSTRILLCFFPCISLNMSRSPT